MADCGSDSQITSLVMSWKPITKYVFKQNIGSNKAYCFSLVISRNASDLSQSASTLLFQNFGECCIFFLLKKDGYEI